MKVSAAVLLLVVVVAAAYKHDNIHEVPDTKINGLPKPAAPFVSTNGLTRAKRQSYYYYLCGTYPNQYYSYYACPTTSNVCTNGGTKIGVGCYYAQDCVPYYSGVSTCISNCCCTVPGVVTTTLPPAASSAQCWPGQFATQSCAGATCPSGQVCTNGLCCPSTQAWQYACGGQSAAAACLNGACGQGFSCTTGQYCCECPVGRSGGLATNGFCPAGYTVNFANNNCCATCANGRSPLGACTTAGTCPNGYACSPGNICCQSTIG